MPFVCGESRSFISIRTNNDYVQGSWHTQCQEMDGIRRDYLASLADIPGNDRNLDSQTGPNSQVLSAPPNICNGIICLGDRKAQYTSENSFWLIVICNLGGLFKADRL